MADVLKTYLSVIGILVVFMLIMLYRDSQQQQLFLSLSQDEEHELDIQPSRQNDHSIQFGHDNDDTKQIADDDENDAMVLHDHNAHGHDQQHQHSHVAHDIEDDDDSHEHAQPLPLVEDRPWGEIYAAHPRIICLVPTLWPKMKFVMEAIATTWGARCDKLFFVIDDEVAAPDTLFNATVLKLTFDHKQSTKDRNIWEKVWKMWLHIGVHHLDDGDFFFKIDDDSFFSAVNFRGFAQYYNPDGAWYFGHTLMHTWHVKNVVFNSGTCYGISRGALRAVFPIFQTPEFLDDRQRKNSKSYCVHRSGDQEDPTMGICLRSLGINPTNTLDNNFRERFLAFRPSDHANIPRERSWFWKHKHPKVGDKENCCSVHPVSFHNFKKNAYMQFAEMDAKYNIEAGVDGKTFEVPMNRNNGTFLFNVDTVPEHDEWFNVKNIPPGQRIYKGPGKERFCNKCDRFSFK